MIIKLSNNNSFEISLYSLLRLLQNLRTVTDRASKTVYQLTCTPDSTVAALTVTVNGMVISSRSPHNLTATYAYDALGRKVSEQDARGAVHSRGYDDAGRVAWESDAAGNRTTYAYDMLGRRTAVTDALGHVTHTAYDLQGRTIATWGATYPVAYEYDALGRMTAMLTSRDSSLEISGYSSFILHPSSFDRTTWSYDHPTGLLTNKLYADGSCVRYTYTPSGLLASRVWSRGVVTEYSYDALGQLTNVNYGGSAPAVAYAYDRLGRMLSAISPVSYSLYAYTGLELTEEIQDGWLFTRPADGFGRGAGYALRTPDDHGSPAHSVGYGYSALGQFSFVRSAHSAVSNTFGYTYLDGTDIPDGYTASADMPFLAVAKTYEPGCDLIASVTNSVLPVPSAISSFCYANNAAGHRLSRVDAGSVTNLFTNNGRDEVTEAVMGANAYAYGYDGIGNRVFSALNAVTNTYTANSLNQYTAVTPSVAVAYDADGNMTRLGGWYHTWDGENRLVQSQPYGLATNGAIRLEYVYNHKNLRVAKIKKRLSGRGASYPFDPSQPGTWDAIETRRYVWDGYNIAAEIVIDEVTPSTNVTYYTWGLDLSGTLQGAGGVGGLLAVVRNGTPNFPCYDANGNVTDYVDAAGNIRAHYEYSPFGEIVAQSGDLANTFTHRFSTKPFDAETGLVMYQLRPYAPRLGRWMSRDPIGDLAFMRLYLQTSKVTVMEYVNLLAAGRLPPYLFVLNNPLSSVDAHGLDITLTTGNKGAAWWQVGNRFLHQEICVDTWVNDPSNPCCRKKGPRKCFSFAATGFGFDWPSSDWLGQESCRLGGPLQGEVYGTGDQGRKDSKSLKTTCEQDEEFLKKLEGMEGQSGTYSLLRHSCRTFSQMMFDEASQAYGQNPDSGAEDKDCECPKK